MPRVDALVVHYSASGADEQTNHANCAARVRGIQNYHMNGKIPCDIAYNFLFCKHGYVFVGRGWYRKAGATGAANSHTIAVCFLGDDTAGADDVTYDGREALGEWLRAASARFNTTKVDGHRDYMQTSCPGDELYGWISTSAWKTIGIKRVRFELWARRRDAAGKWQPYLVQKSIAVPLANAGARSLAFETRTLARRAALAARNRRPTTRRVVV
jgi:hypothetical protein